MTGEEEIMALLQSGKASAAHAMLKKRSLDQNAIFHAMMDDIASSNVEWAGQRWSADDWKALMVSAHAMATRGEHADRRRTVICGLEGELVQLRESTAKMSKERATSLIEYVMAWCAQHGVALREKEPA